MVIVVAIMILTIVIMTITIITIVMIMIITIIMIMIITIIMIITMITITITWNLVRNTRTSRAGWGTLHTIPDPFSQHHHPFLILHQNVQIALKCILG